MARSITHIPARQTTVTTNDTDDIQKKKVAAYCRVSTDQIEQISSYQEYLNGKGPTRIARELEQDQVKGVTGTTKWYTTTIDKILRNEKYKGDALLQKTYTIDFLNKTRVKNEGQVPQYYVEESHPAIIQPDMWDAVQLEIERRKKYIE